MGEPTNLRGPQVCAVAGITYRQLDWWCRLGKLRPPVAAAGSGSQRLFDLRETQIAWAMGVLSKLTGRLPDLAMLRQLPRWGGWLVVHDDGVAHTFEPDELGLWPISVVIDLGYCPIGALPAREEAIR